MGSTLPEKPVGNERVPESLEEALRERMTESLDATSPEDLRAQALKAYVIGQRRRFMEGEGSGATMWFAESAALSGLAQTVNLRREAYVAVEPEQPAA